MFSIQRLINEPFEIYSKELSESFEILSPKKEFLGKNIGNYNPTDFILFSYLLHVLCTKVPMGNALEISFHGLEPYVCPYQNYFLKVALQ